MEANNIFEAGEITGDNPGNSDLLFGPAGEHFTNRAEAFKATLAEGHEVSTIIDGRAVSTELLSLRAKHASRTYTARFTEGIGEHKREIVIGLTVAGVLLAANQLRIKRKK
ncbi:hypothetical protein H0X09_03140 [Candidatus Saccharibacteria bacterium]|nr:hypothetical protein [Candidatus Saccharibacteria bacterium]